MSDIYIYQYKEGLTLETVFAKTEKNKNDRRASLSKIRFKKLQIYKKLT